ncbi:MAG: alpha/beta hydrolase [Porticoccaceae bacterium]|nr:alpha/beta hydrolase [Pseudomonadales bacterium]MCP5172220.1 alpha/beta hydrolase [Pseudomonadales bacterium]
MDWILLALAVFNAFSMVTIYRDRHTKRLVPPWTLFAHSLISSELAWLWLPMQVTMALILFVLGATESTLGGLSLLVLVVSWVFLMQSIRNAFKAEKLTRRALQKALGDNYLETLPPEVRAKIETATHFREWLNPFKMKRPEVEVLKNIAYGPLGVMHQLDVYRPKNIPAEGCPVLMQIHGGAWVMGSKDLEALPLLHYMASKGWICVTINYRLSPSVGFPAHLEDCKLALKWIRTEGKKYGVNPEFVAVTGGSAGGHLATLLGMTQNQPELQREFPDVDTSVQAVVSLYGVYDLLGTFHADSRDLMVGHLHNKVIYESPEENPQLWELASPSTQIRGNLPSIMIVQGEIDSLTTVSGARLFYQNLRGVIRQPAVYLELPGAEHAFDHMHSPRTEPVIKGIHSFLEWNLVQYRADKNMPTNSAGLEKSLDNQVEA